MRFFLDTEFIEDGKTIDLISIGIVSEDGRTFYEVSSEFDESKANDWVKANVLPFIKGSPRVSRAEIRNRLLQWIGFEVPEFWGYYADYDWVVFCQLFGCMIDLPKDWPMYCRDIKQLCDSVGNPKLPSQTGEHHALEDAKWNKKAYEFLVDLSTPVPVEV